ncbi:MAG: AsmA family protein [Terriglobales bacterium]
MRRTGIIILIAVVAVIVVALLVIPHFSNVNRYRGRVQAEMEQQLGRPVSLGNMHLKLLPPSFQVENVVIGENPRFGERPFATVQKVNISVKLGPLLHRRIEISSLVLDRPNIELVRNSEGVWNFSTLGEKPRAEKPKGPAPQEQLFSLGRLKISDGTVAVTDLQKHQPRAIYDHIDASLKDFAPGKPFDIALAAHLPGKGAQTLSLDGTAGPINQAAPANTPFKGKLKLDEVEIAGLQKFLNTQVLANTNAVISGIANLSNENGKFSSDGSLKIEKAQVRGVEIGYPINTDYKLTDDLAGNVIHVDKANINLGGTPLAISGTLNTGATPAQMDMHLDASNVSISEAARLASAFGVAFSPKTKVDGRLTADVRARGAADRPLLNGKLSASNLVVSGGDLPQPVRVPSVEFALSPQDIRSNEFSATTGATTVNMRFTLAQYTTKSPNADADLKTANAKIAELLSMGRAYGVSALDGVTGSGMLTLNVHASGPLKNLSAMKFNGSGQIQNASLKPPSLRQPLNVRNADLQFSSNAATLQNLSASLGQTNATGDVTVRNFAAPQVQFTLNADKVNVVELQTITAGTPAQPPRAAADFWHLIPRAEAQTAPPHTSAGGILSKVTGSGTASVGTLLYDQLVLTNVHSKVNLDRGIIRFSPLTAQLYDGQETGSIVVDTRTSPMAINVSSKLTGVKANDLISSVSSLKNTIYGLLAASTQTNFRIADTSNIARSLNGTLALDLTKGRIARIDLLNQLASIGQFAGLVQNPQPFTDVLKLTGNFDIRNGVALTNNLQAVIQGGTLAANGSVDLAEQALNLHLTAVLSKALSDKAGGTNIGGFMSTALANNRGELVIPVIVTGTFDHPRFAPDVQKIAAMKMQNLLPSMNNPGQLTTGILGSVLKGGRGQVPGGLGGVLGAITGQQQQQKQQDQQQKPQSQQPVATPQQQQQQSPNPLQEALEGIFGGKKRQQQQSPPPQR